MSVCHKLIIPPGVFSKVGSREWIFLIKLRGLWRQNIPQNLCLDELKFMAKARLSGYKIFEKIEDGGYMSEAGM